MVKTSSSYLTQYVCIVYSTQINEREKHNQFSNFLQVWFGKNNRLQVILGNRQLKEMLTHSAWLHRIRFLNVKMVKAWFLAGLCTILSIIQVRRFTVFINFFLFKYQKLALQLNRKKAVILLHSNIYRTNLPEQQILKFNANTQLD